MHYLPLILRMKRLYISNSLTPNMIWYGENRRPLSVMCHLYDGESRKDFDITYSDFATEPRNIRLGL